MWDFAQHTLLAIVAGLRGASDNTLYWVLLWVTRGFGQHTLLGIIRSDVGHLHLSMGSTYNLFFINNSRKVEVSVSVSPPKLLKRISPHKQNHMVLLSCFPINQPLQTCHNATNLIFTNLHLPPNRPEDGCASVIVLFLSAV
jgi:hypothetical protein